MKKLLFILMTLLFTSCIQLQVPIASNVTNVTVIKTQVTTDAATMSGSSLEDIRKGADKAGDVTTPLNK